MQDFVQQQDGPGRGIGNSRVPVLREDPDQANYKDRYSIITYTVLVAPSYN